MSTLANINDNPPAQADHDARGRFRAGNKSGPGNPFAGQVALLRQAMLECVTKEDILAVFKSLVELAKEGHWQAAKLVLAYTIGKPQAFAEFAFELDDAQPSANGEIQDVPPSTNGEIDETPPLPPLTNGEIDGAPPSTNGTQAPALNRQQRRALRKAHRLAKQQRNTPKPAPTGPVPAN